MCTTLNQDLKEINKLALNHMATDFEYNGSTYNMLDLGWCFEFNDRKRALGLCSKRRKTIYLSKWLIENSDNGIDTWNNTILHEIAHAIDFEIRGRSAHDYHWRRIAKTIGCDGQRCSVVDYAKDVQAKYTTKCDNCGRETPSHKRSKRIEQGRVACGKCCNGTFNKKYVLRQIQNY